MRVPPSWTYSATTPALRPLTSSRKRGGQDHSRPTSSPTLCMRHSRRERPPWRSVVARNATEGVPYSVVSRLVIALRQALQPAERVLDHPPAVRLEPGGWLHLVDALVERGKVLLVPLLHRGVPRRRGPAALAQQCQYLHRRHEQALAVLVGHDALVVADHLADGGDQLGRHHRQVIAGAVVAEVVFRPLAHPGPPSVVAPDVHGQHPCPHRPVVSEAVPDPQGVPDALLPEQPREVLVAPQQRVVAPDGEDDIQSLQRVQSPGILLVGDVFHRIIEVDVLVVVSVRNARYIVNAAHAQYPPHQPWVAQGEVDRVVRPEARPRADEVRVAVDPPRARQHLVGQVAVVLHAAAGALLGVHPATVPRLSVHLIEADNLEVPRLQVPVQRPDEAAVLPVVVRVLRRRERQHARPGVAEDEQLHVPAERGAEPTVVVAVHGRGPGG